MPCLIDIVRKGPASMLANAAFFELRNGRLIGRCDREAGTTGCKCYGDVIAGKTPMLSTNGAPEYVCSAVIARIAAQESNPVFVLKRWFKENNIDPES